MTAGFDRGDARWMVFTLIWLIDSVVSCFYGALGASSPIVLYILASEVYNVYIFAQEARALWPFTCISTGTILFYAFPQQSPSDFAIGWALHRHRNGPGNSGVWAAAANLFQPLFRIFCFKLTIKLTII